MNLFAYLAGSILIGLIPAVIAKRKGRPFLAWWLYGAVFFLIALPHAIIMKQYRPGLELRSIKEDEGA
jgi:hypothetical protein